MADHSIKGRLPLRTDRTEKYIFCDESGLDDRFFVLGSLTGSSHPGHMIGVLDCIKDEHGLRKEIKWERFPSNSKYFNGYKAVVARFMDLPLTYKALIVDTKQYPLNHPVFAGKNKTLGYFQYYLVLLYFGIIKHEPFKNTRIYLHRPAYHLQGGLEVLEQKMNEAAMEAGFPDMVGNSCCRISAHSSQNNSLLQLTDILTGMVSSIWNDKLGQGTKKQLAKQKLVQECSGWLRQDISKPSASRHVDVKFNRWLFRPNPNPDTTRWPALCPPTNRSAKVSDRDRAKLVQ